MLVTQVERAREADADAGDARASAGWPGIPDQVWRRTGSGLSLAAVVLLIAVALAELDRLISSVPGADGQSHSLNLVLSPFSVLQRGSWNAWAAMPWHDEIGLWIILSAILDGFMVAAYAALLLRLVLTAPEKARIVPWVAFAWIIVAEIIEGALQLGAGTAVAVGMDVVAGRVGRVMGIVTLIKVLGFVVFGVAMLRIPEYRSWIASRLARIGRAIWVHRLAALAIVALLVLACIPAADLLDQLPDVQRQWADGAVGYSHAAFGIAAILLTGLLTFALGRRRTRYMIETRVHRRVGRRSPNRWHAAGPWLIAPAAQVLLAVVALALGALGGPNGAVPAVHLPTFVAVLAVELTVAVLAAATWGWTCRHPARRLPRSVERAADSWVVGDALAAIVLVVGAVGVVRSFLVPVVLGGSSASTLGWWFVPLSVAVAVLAPWAVMTGANLAPWLRRLIRRSRLDPTRSLGDDGVHVSKTGRVEWLALAIGMVVLFIGLLVPAWIGETFGAVTVMLVSLDAWVAVFGAFTLIVQARALIAPFRWMRMKAAPVITLGLIVPLVINVALSAMPGRGFADTALHEVHVSATSPEPNPVVETALHDRLVALRSEGDCAVDVDADGDGETDGAARPVFLIASEGGGIRAAYWTTSVLGALDGCAAKSGLVASGISGGSVGLALASAADDDEQRDPTSLVDDATQLSQPAAVSTGALALVIGDAVGGGWGVHVPSYLDPADGDDHGWRWRDRAALIEALWERGTPLDRPFTNEIDPLTGALLMNSADVVTKCRLLVQQAPIIEKRTTAAAAAGQGACDATGGLPSMLQFGELPGLDDAQKAADCLAGLDWSTAAMLSARFAVITPTGSMPGRAPCDGVTGAQFVDGGYVEPTSLATIADIAPELMAEFARVNAEPGSDVALVPVLLYLRNSQGYDLVTDVARAEAEPLAPITGNAARVRLTGQDAWIQRIALAMSDACPAEGAPTTSDTPTADDATTDPTAADAAPTADTADAPDTADTADTAEDAATPPPTCGEVAAALTGPDGVVAGGVVVVAPASEPAVVPPLGWALSEASRARFSEALRNAAACTTDGDTVSTGERLAASHHYPGLDRVPALFGVESTGMCDRIEAQLADAG